MEWLVAKNIVEAKIKSGIDVNTSKSTYRTINAVDAPIDSGRYGYQNQLGFVVQIGQNNFINIPWSVLEECFKMLRSEDGYSGKSFRKVFPIQAKDHPCHVHVIGQIFVRAGLAKDDDGIYWPL